MVTLAIQLVWEAIIIASSGIVLLATYIVRRRLQKHLQGKSLFFTGPEMAGKTTLINWIIGKDFVKDYTPTTDIDTFEYKDEKHDFSITDMGGGAEFLETHGFDKLVREHDITIFVFDVNKCFFDEKYCREEVGDRLDFLWHMENEIVSLKKILLIVGSHHDKAEMIITQDVRKEFYELLKGKEYAKIITKHPPIFANLTNKKDVKMIMLKLEQLIEKAK